MASHPLDRPVWSALTRGWAAYAEGDARAWRLAPDYGVFAAPADWSDANMAALRELIPEGGERWLIEAAPPPEVPGTRVTKRGLLHQMLLEALSSAPDPGFEMMPLGEADAAEMFALARLTEPGPYARWTHRLGDFHGVKADGRLVAMAGERMRAPGFAEVSGVCTHPDWRGRGYAGALMRRVIAAILARGETPFLHSYASNAGAIALYESLGFRFRSEIHAVVIVRA